MRGKLSAVVVSYNRAPLIGTCLRAVGFADEVIVVDKSSTDDTRAIAARLADRVITVPWSPTVEETRAFAVAQCSHDWIVCLDDDECLSGEAIRFIQAELAAPRADVYRLLLRHYIVGTHEEAAYYWPEHQIRLFRRGAVTFSGRVHGGMEVHSDNVYRLPPDTGVAVHNLSHESVAQWIDKTNRYTSRPDRERVADLGRSLVRFAHDRIDHWVSRSHCVLPGSYPEAVAVLRATYDLVDRLKTWEEERGVNGAAEFQRVCADLDAEYATLGLMRDRAGETVQAAPYVPKAVDEHEVLRRRLAHFRARYDALAAERDSRAAEATRLAGELASVGKMLDETREALNVARQQAEWAERETVALRRRAEQAETERDCALDEAAAQRQRARLAEADSLAQRQSMEQAASRLDALIGEHHMLQGSLRTFLRGYVPRLRHHLFGQRP